MRILGLDPGLRHTGWGIVDSKAGHLQFVACGTIHPPADVSMAQRLKALHDGIGQVIREWTPDEAGVEETFLNKNPGTTLKLGHARGVVLLVPALFGLPVAEYAAKTVKQAVVGTGGASKDQIGVMVRMLLPGCDPSGEDAADALAVAICHGHHADTGRQWAAGRVG
ncbi:MULTISPECIES: crossover junction endodeoxyribonuclease RuvC [unclassified Hwanghaeella]|mgnify:FL=1|jgi:crossover junction endodeoxyribonuclease RuvC|uniref:crossover junction endodeoxyribonuclease RuvC n=1 Tax=unclassified Hwanghaeella TaxID=2605944 RepID=UPI000C9580ED|nr:crossover junction endodeoxyribonuclease RuvC [Rhodospirillales bacterium]|tara:strand:- start:16481 stop:16981 length:501 start_codon:yes stop_codon:yes gene_type:complete